MVVWPEAGVERGERTSEREDSGMEGILDNFYVGL